MQMGNRKGTFLCLIVLPPDEEYTGKYEINRDSRNGQHWGRTGASVEQRGIYSERRSPRKLSGKKDPRCKQWIRKGDCRRSGDRCARCTMAGGKGSAGILRRSERNSRRGLHQPGVAGPGRTGDWRHNLCCRKIAAA